MSATWPCPRCDFRGPHLHFPLPPEAQESFGATHWTKCGRCIVQDVWAPPDPPGDGITTPDLRHVAPAYRDKVRDDLDAGLGFGTSLWSLKSRT